MTDAAPFPTAETPARVAWVVARRALIVGAGLWFIVPPTSAENLVRAIGGAYPLIILWWYANGPGPQRRWVPATLLGAGQIAAALLFARGLEFAARLFG